MAQATKNLFAACRDTAEAHILTPVQAGADAFFPQLQESLPPPQPCFPTAPFMVLLAWLGES
jgi:hypothetical protein